MNENWLVYRRDVDDNYEIDATSKHERLSEAKDRARSEYAKQSMFNRMFFDFVVRHWMSDAPVFSAMHEQSRKD